MEIIYKLKINDDFLIEYREYKQEYINHINLIYKGEYVVCYIEENHISILDDIIIKELKEIDNIIIKYIIEIDKLNKENKLNINDIKEIYENLKYIIKENNKKEIL